MIKRTEDNKATVDSSLENDNNKLNIKKRIVKTVCFLVAVVLGLFAVVSVGDFLVGKLASKKFDLTVKQDGIYYFPEDYSTDINERLLYTVKERRVYLVDASRVGGYLTEDNPITNSKVGVLFNSYFEALVNGDSVALDSLFTDNYFKAHVNPKRFTPQMVYDIKVEFYNSQSSDEGYIERYIVSFKLMENNGSFRADVRSDAAKPLVYEVQVGDSNARITAVYPVVSQ